MSENADTKVSETDVKNDAKSGNDTSCPSILMIVGDYGEDYEIMVPYQLLLSVGFNVDAVCPNKKKGHKIKTSVHDFEGDQTYSEKRGHNFELTQDFKYALDNVKQYKGLVLPGGRAPEYLSINKDVISLVTYFTKNKIPIASVCHGPLILASIPGYLKDKACTSYAACAPVMKQTECKFTPPNASATTVVVSDCNTLVTGPAWPCQDVWMNKYLTVLGVKFKNCNKKILMLGGDYVEDYEIMCPFQMLQCYGYTVHVICPDKKKGDIIKTCIHDFEGDQTYSEKRGHNFALNKSFNDLFTDVNKSILNNDEISNYDGIYIPGGRAPEYLSLNKNVLTIVKYFIDNKKPIGVICHGVLILAAIENALKGKIITSYPACSPIMKILGAKYQNPEPITSAFVDENCALVSSGAWPAHPETIKKFVKILGGSVSM